MVVISIRPGWILYSCGALVHLKFSVFMLQASLSDMLFMRMPLPFLTETPYGAAADRTLSKLIQIVLQRLDIALGEVVRIDAGAAAGTPEVLLVQIAIGQFVQFVAYPADMLRTDAVIACLIDQAQLPGFKHDSTLLIVHISFFGIPGCPLHSHPSLSSRKNSRISHTGRFRL